MYKGIAVGGTQAGKFLTHDDTRLEVHIPMPELGPYVPEMGVPGWASNPVKDRERYTWRAGLAGEFEINFWLHETVKTPKDALQIIFQFYHDKALDAQ